MCAKCVKTCANSSIQLNLRLAPQELWALETPRQADSFLIVSMAAIFFPFALQSEFVGFVGWLVSKVAETGVVLPVHGVASVIFFTLILVFQVGFYLTVTLEALYAGIDKKLLLSLSGYGVIPLILGGYMAVHMELFVGGAGRIVPNVKELLGMQPLYENVRLISADSTYVLQFLTVMGGLLASLYATYRVVERAMAGDAVTSKALAIPFTFLIALGGVFVFMV